MKKLAIYDPYFHILGGAERYVFSFASCIQDKYEITIFSSDNQILEKARKKFGLNLNNYQILPWTNDRKKRDNLLKRQNVFIYVTDGSLFFSRAQKNILLIQSPQHIPKNNLVNKIKLISWQKIICYSQFMADVIKKRLNKDVQILFVPIVLPQIKYQKKENIIVTVGRFFPNLHNKKQLEMVQEFKKLTENGIKNTKFIIIGSIDPGAMAYFNEVKKAALGLEIEIKPDISYSELSQIYQKAKIYWHAAGINEDLEKYPEKAEHFGVSTVEAMSYGCVPIVFAGGGQKEIVINGINGYTFQTETELRQRTRETLMNNDLCNKLSTQAVLASKNYSLEKFSYKINEIIQK